MSISVYNTMTRRKEAFEPREPGRVSMYVCGPTVYNHIHIGNARTFLSFDVIRRYLEFRDFEVAFVQNITDVDDKIIARANEEGRPSAEVAVEYTIAFQEAMRELGVMRPTVAPKATETIPEMIAMIELLIERAHAYEVEGDVYFAVRSFADYGKLSGRDIDEMNSGARVEVDERKRDPLDFALWKAAKPGEPHWPSPWGEGRPGWHLECSVMSEKELGITFDIHGGASDLIFPHHENEIAQSEASTGQPFSRYWLHGGLLRVNAEKMSKSLGNFMLLRDVLAEYEPAVVRLMMLQTHYRSPLEFSTARLDEARVAYERLTTPLRDIGEILSTQVSWAVGEASSADRIELVDAIEKANVTFIEEMDDDFNTAGALAAVFDLVRVTNRFLNDFGTGATGENVPVLKQSRDAIVTLLGALGIETPVRSGGTYPPEVVPVAAQLAGYSGSDPAEAVDALLAARSVARSERNWAAADAVRDGLGALGLMVEDTPQGARVTYHGQG
ncbi:MAG: cysteine--tRNA ligase [Coriobacteriia bacterium]|nr:cysteine--tRNA ligase [Coriobacteriia bacterium]